MRERECRGEPVPKEGNYAANPINFTRGLKSNRLEKQEVIDFRGKRLFGVTPAPSGQNRLLLNADSPWKEGRDYKGEVAIDLQRSKGCRRAGAKKTSGNVTPKLRSWDCTNP